MTIIARPNNINPEILSRVSSEKFLNTLLNIPNPVRADCKPTKATLIISPPEIFIEAMAEISIEINLEINTGTKKPNKTNIQMKYIRSSLRPIFSSPVLLFVIFLRTLYLLY